MKDQANDLLSHIGAVSLICLSLAMISIISMRLYKDSHSDSWEEILSQYCENGKAYEVFSDGRIERMPEGTYICLNEGGEDDSS